MSLLELKDINVYYGAIHALKGISLNVEEGQVVSLIGANGAGKTTTLRTISGLLRSKTGSISFMGKELRHESAESIVRLGISHCPEGRRVFADMSVKENLEMGAFTRKDRKEISQTMDMIYDHFPRLKERMNQMAGTLSGGEQQMLAMGRALMSKPKLLLLDEPSMGLAPILVKEIFNMVQEIHDMGTTVLLVEQNARMALAISDYAYVLETGHISLEGEAKSLAESEEVRKVYLGG